MRREKCPGCEVLEGQLHEMNCGKEICPFCHTQLLFCGCWEDKLRALDFQYLKRMTNVRWNYRRNQKISGWKFSMKRGASPTSTIQSFVQNVEKSTPSSSASPTKSGRNTCSRICEMRCYAGSAFSLQSMLSIIRISSYR